MTIDVWTSSADQLVCAVFEICGSPAICHRQCTSTDDHFRALDTMVFI